MGALGIGITFSARGQLGWLLRQSQKNLLHHVLVSAGLAYKRSRMAQKCGLMTMHQRLKGTRVAGPRRL